MHTLCVAVEWGVFRVARLIDAESPQNRMHVSDLVIEEMKKVPAVAAVPVSALLTLRDSLYETDRITMSGLYDLNMLIAKYAQGGKDHAPDRR